MPAPKSLDRNAFRWNCSTSLTTEDGAATLAAFTAGAIARAREHFPDEPQAAGWCVGGRRDRTLMGVIAGHVENAVVPAEAVGLDGDGLEAEAWAYLAVRSLKGLAITFPGTTGVCARSPAGDWRGRRSDRSPALSLTKTKRLAAERQRTPRSGKAHAAEREGAVELKVARHVGGVSIVVAVIATEIRAGFRIGLGFPLTRAIALLACSWRDPRRP